MCLVLIIRCIVDILLSESRLFALSINQYLNLWLTFVYTLVRFDGLAFWLVLIFCFVFVYPVQFLIDVKRRLTQIDYHQNLGQIIDITMQIESVQLTFESRLN